MNRRNFILYCGVGLSVLGGASVLQLFNPAETSSEDKLQDYENKLDEDGLSILHLATLAPSGHNTQPWTVKIIDHHHWIIGTDRTRWLSVVDPENRETLLSIGAFLENLVVAARVKGYDVQVTVLAKQLIDQEILDIKLHKINCPINFDIQKIALRRTVRNNFLGDSLSSQDIRLITEENKESFFYYSRQSKEGTYLAEGTLLANQLQTYRNTAQGELAKWIRWSDLDSRRYRNGLTPETMEIEGISKWYVKKFYSSQSVMDNSFREGTIKKVQQQVVAGSGWLLITSRDSSVQELIDTGRKLQRIWLQVRDEKIAIHPMSQMLEEKQLRHQIASTLGITENIQFLVRIGYVSNYPQPVSPRMFLANIIV